jgi:hypothetical protein
MQLPEDVPKYIGVFQDLCVIYILLCAFVCFLVDAKFVAGVREGVLRKKSEHVREEITGAGENCAMTSFVICSQLRIWLGVGNK